MTMQFPVMAGAETHTPAMPSPDGLISTTGLPRAKYAGKRDSSPHLTSIVHIYGKVKIFKYLI